MMDRRTAFMALVSVMFGKAAAPLALGRTGFRPAQLLVDLDQWGMIVVKSKGRTVEILPEQIFTELVRPE